ncbi:hypothetical protein [Thalassospira sp.]|uniref:hypothetical protein n=1 Tax=Thalassospira sp. TaxID=1912094 RepID=UPI001B166E9D|nr:hypothetical protein [Thalassospira sp.]MBO6807598.1 hypothetical protein [Thalassospira sp.]MBO6840123.1 hypothetical protein [Thalassospira sp.]
MAWQDLGIIFSVNRLNSWARSHAYVPTAIELNEKLRVFAAFLDENMHGRLGYVDVDRDNPSQVIGVSNQPILADSSRGCFDHNGTTPLSAVSDSGGKLKLYYAGWRRTESNIDRYELFTGLAVGLEDSELLDRYSDKPVLGPRSASENVRTVGCVLRLDDGFHCWLATQKGLHGETGKALPIYDLEHVVSKDGLVWPEEQKTVLRYSENEVLGYGRSAIWEADNGGFEGLFSVRNWDGTYTDILYSTSEDGINWAPLSRDGMAFCAKMTCDGQRSVSFPNIIHQDGRKLMFYNGNDFGREGLRLAIWTD